jgi:hypothetical protein
MGGMRTELIIILLSIPVGLIWFLFASHGASTPVALAVGALSGLLLFWIIRMNEKNRSGPQ